MSGQIFHPPLHPPLLEILARRLALPVDAVARARASLHVVDWFGQATYGAQMDEAQGFAGLSDSGAAGECATLAGHRRDWYHALALNAAVGNLLEMDDLHRTSILHPGPVIVPAAIAVAEAVNASGEELLSAIVRAYEITIRIGRALGTSHYRYFHNTSTCGAFGAAAAAASLLKLDDIATVSALANAGSRTGGLWQMRHEPCETKSMHNMAAAQTGVASAWLAKGGVRGPTRLLEGAQGLFAAMADGAAVEAVVEHLEQRWQIHEVSFKPWPACRHAHPAIDAMRAVCATVEAGTTVESVEIATYKSAIDFCDKPTPRTTLEAKFSLQHCAALVLDHARPTIADFAVDALDSPKIAALRARIRVVEDPAMTQAFPQHYAARATLILADGRTLSHTANDAWGDPECPLSAEDVMAKADGLLALAGVANAGTRLGLLRATLDLDTVSHVREWTAQWPMQCLNPTRMAAA
jgi:2-methylcitrate dehydratase PrpD